MEDSSTKSPNEIPSITIEIVSDEEMVLIETVFAATRSSFSASASASTGSSLSSSAFSSSSQFKRNVRSIQSISSNSKRRLLDSFSEKSKTVDIEDLGDLKGSNQKKIKVLDSFLNRFRRKTGLSVTDLTSSEWCEKQMEFVLLYGKPRINKAMKAGRARHAKLEEEVVNKVKVRSTSVEDVWAAKFVNFLICANQLSIQGVTRELPLIGFVKGVWLVGVIDEIRMPLTETPRKPVLVETKTRCQPTLPTEPQKRNGRFQLMCYKYLWDSVVTDNFPANKFFNHFGLNPQFILSEEIQGHAASLGFPTKTLEDLLKSFRTTCCTLPLAHNELMLRYEFQEDHSLLGEDPFTYNSDWLKSQIQFHLEFWLGEREAIPVPPEERWKCQSQFCQFASICPLSNTTTDSTPPS